MSHIFKHYFNRFHKISIHIIRLRYYFSNQNRTKLCNYSLIPINTSKFENFFWSTPKFHISITTSKISLNENLTSNQFFEITLNSWIWSNQSLILANDVCPWSKSYLVIENKLIRYIISSFFLTTYHLCILKKDIYSSETFIHKIL